MRIRPESASDRTAVRAVNEAAFETSVEADLIDALHAKGVRLISLVAEVDGQIVGHILFSPVSLAEHPNVRVMRLGPMAVVPRYQRQGIGSALVTDGLKQCERLGCHAVVVVGHPHYYPRFGFAPASTHAIRCEYEVPDNVFMIVELRTGALQGASGLIRYDDAFASV